MNIEDSSELTLDFNKLEGVVATGAHCIPLVIQDYLTKQVLIVGYVNQVALEHTQKTGYATLWSTSRGELWEKGKTSGDRLKMVEIWVNCEQNSLLYLVIPEGAGACHTRDEAGKSRVSCFYRKLTEAGSLNTPSLRATPL
jgi:phosphoribosyl-AMP cyclohydrolase